MCIGLVRLRVVSEAFVLLLMHCFPCTLPAVAAINGLYVALGSPPLPGWTASGGDPCGESWQGVTCIGTSINSMYVRSCVVYDTFLW
jgi:hypothetical protein